MAPIPGAHGGQVSSQVVNGYAQVTEVPGGRASREQLVMLYTRYAFAGERCAGKQVLEVACGAGMGLGYLGGAARRVVGGDYDRSLLQVARGHYGRRIPLLALDGHCLPFRDRTFDVVVLFEALYYLKDVGRFLEEARRVLRPGGVVLLCSANREWPGFNRSPFSHAYLSAAELRRALRNKAFDVELYAAFPAAAATPRDRLVGGVRRVAVAMHLIPASMKGKEFLKRIFFGPLQAIPAEVTRGMAGSSPLVPIGDASAVPNYKVLYAVGRVR